MQKLVFTNGGGNTIDLTSGNFGITNWEGLSGVGLNIQTQQVPFQDGGVFLDALMEQREITVTVAIQDNNDLSARYERKRELISALNPKLGEGVLVYTNDYLSRQIKAVPQLPIFENKNSNDSGTLKASVTFSCSSPYWEDLEETEVNLNKGYNTIQNNGDVSVGVKIKIQPNTKSPVFINQSVEKMLALDVEYENGVLINTNEGVKSVIGQDLYFSWKGGGDFYGSASDNKTMVFVGNTILAEDLLTGKLKNIAGDIGFYINGIVYSKEKKLFVAVGDSNILTSSDGEHWVSQTVGGSNATITLNSVFYSAEQELFIAVGRKLHYQGTLSIIDNCIITSPDGMTWTEQNTGTQSRSSNKLVSVTFGNGQFITVGNNGTILTSPDGETWTQQTSGVNINLNCISFSKVSNIFITVGTNGTILTSVDGITWTQQTSGISNTIYSVCFGNNLFIATSEVGLLESRDGVEWSLQTGEIIGNSIVYNNGLFVLCGKHIYISSDGENWIKKIDNNFSASNINTVLFSEETEQFVILCSDKVLTSPDGITWTQQTSGITGFLYHIIYAGGKFLIVGRNGLILTSPDGITWTQQTSGTTEDLLSVTYGENKYVIVGGNGIILTSPDGITWTTQTSGTTRQLRSVTFGNGVFVIVGGLSGNEIILTSPDGITWTQQTSGLVYIWNNVVYGNNVFIAEGLRTVSSKTYRVIATSLNGSVWTEKLLDRTTSTYIVFCNNLFITSKGTNCLISKDGIVWEQRIVESSEVIKLVAYGKGKYIAASNSMIFDSLKSPQTNIISKLSNGSDMTFCLDKGENIILFTNDGSESAILYFRQKYIGV